MFKGTRWITLERCDKFLSDIYFTDTNIKSKIHFKTFKEPVVLSVYSVPNLKRISYDEAVKNEYKKTKVGDSFGPSWSTHWFKVECEIPKEWKGLCVQFQWDSDSEALVWENGIPKQAFTGGNGCDRRAEYELLENAQGGERYSFYVEMACNGMFGVGKDGLINAPEEKRNFSVKTAQLVVIDKEAYGLYLDLKVIHEMAKELPEESSRGKQALWTINEMINVIDTDDKSTWKKAREISKKFLSQKNGESQHNIMAIGHCHIDVAWLWPYDETKRKAARSFATQILYMDKYPNFIFAQSNAQLFQWVKDLYPELYLKIKEKVKSGQMVLVGGSWVEMCGNLPSGESQVRQFLLGQKFFKEEFGIHCTEFWLPDSFGYNGQLPQIMRLSGIDSFLTQKLSWNLINKFPHSTFLWEGLDGSKVYTHFPPSDTYNDNVEIPNILKNVTNFKDKERSSHSLMLFGNGDGGGGPSVEMIERLERVKDVDGIPRVTPSAPKEFFDQIKKDDQEKGLLTWQGELYLEFHRGTYTSQASTKKGNRKGEFMMRNVEILSCISYYLKNQEYPSKEIDYLWKLLLLNQFHDVLPGSSIGLVYKDALQFYGEIQTKGKQILSKSLDKLFDIRTTTEITVLNNLSWDRKEVIELPDGLESIQKSYNGRYLGIANVPCLGFSKLTSKEWNENNDSLKSKETDNTIEIENDFIKLSFSKKTGQMDLFDKRVKRKTIENGNTFLLFDDVPLFWDAWDIEIYHLQKKKVLKNVSIKLIEKGPLRISIELICDISKTSKIHQIISLTSISSRIDFNTNISWDENRKLLKVQFPTSIRSTFATYECQFGHLQRPTHYNTSWDVARFEVPAQKWADLSEYGYGISLLNDCKYGYDIHDGIMNMSLLRAPKAPDDQCDIGSHQFVYSIFPHLGTFQDGNVIQESYNLNDSLMVHNLSGNDSMKSFFSVDKKNVIIEAVKRSEDQKGVIIRFYEAFGGRTEFKFNTSLFKVSKSMICNLLEEKIKEIEWKEDGVSIEITPFQIITLFIE